MLVVQVQIWSLVPSAVLPPGISKHLSPKTLTLPPVNVHFCAAAPVQPWRVTRAPSVLDAAVMHFANHLVRRIFIYGRITLTIIKTRLEK